MKSTTILMVLSLVAIGLFAGCEKKGSAEKVGEQIDEGVNKIQEKAEDATEDLKERVNE